MSIFHDASRLEPRYPAARPAPIPHVRLAEMLNQRDGTLLLKREPASATTTTASSPGKSCGPKDTTGFCERPVSSTSNTTIPIVLGVVIPILISLAVLLFLHRRHVRKLRSEDADERHRSLDFGMEEREKLTGKKGKHAKPMPQMSVIETQEAVRRERGLSMDVDLTDPFLLPPGLQQSQESLHSLSRIIISGDDKYQPAATFTSSDTNGLSPSKLGRALDDSSSHTSSSRRGLTVAESHQNLLRHAQRMSTSPPPTQRNSLVSGASTLIAPEPSYAQGSAPPRKVMSPTPPNSARAPVAPEKSRSSFVVAVSNAGDRNLGTSIEGEDVPKNNGSRHLLATAPSVLPVSTAEASANEQESRHTPLNTFANPTTKKEIESLPGNTHRATTLPQPQSELMPAPANDGDGFVDVSRNLASSPIPKPTGADEPRSPEFDFKDPVVQERKPQPEPALEPEYDAEMARQRTTMGRRPLPPDDPRDNPEQRASRIRSFYKEYFDESKPRTFHPPVDYYEDSYKSYENDVLGYGNPAEQPVSAPFAEPFQRRAMTPPPRTTSRPHGFEHSRTITSGEAFMPPGSRAYSSASGRLAPRAKIAPAKKKISLPGPLQSLPTPHMLKDDTFLPIDFAPPSTYNERRAGTPGSPKGSLRSFSPALSAHLPLASSFDDLSVMPSP